MKYLRNMGIAASALLLMQMNASAKTTLYFQGKANKIECYEVKDGKMYPATKKYRNFPDIKKKIDQKSKYITKLSNEIDYFDSVYTIKYFDPKRAERKAYQLVKSSSIAEADKRRFANSCRYWPSIKFLSEVNHLDPYLVYLILYTESPNFIASTGSCGEIGIAQIMPKTGKKHQKEWRKSKYWISGESFRNPVNNLIGGISHIKAGMDTIGCKKNLEEMSAQEVLAVYSFYTTGKPSFDLTTKYSWPDNISNNIRALYLIPYLDKASLYDKMINKEGRDKLDNLRKQMKEARTKSLEQKVSVSTSTAKKPDNIIISAEKVKDKLGLWDYDIIAPQKYNLDIKKALEN